MPNRRRFPPSRSVEELVACFVVRDRGGQALAYVYLRTYNCKLCGVTVANAGTTSPSLLNAESFPCPFRKSYPRVAMMQLSFPKIISARSDDAVHPRRAQQRRYQTVGLLDAVAHPCAV